MTGLDKINQDLLNRLVIARELRDELEILIERTERLTRDFAVEEWGDEMMASDGIDVRSALDKLLKERKRNTAGICLCGRNETCSVCNR